VRVGGGWNWPKIVKVSSFTVGIVETSSSATTVLALDTGSCYPLILNIKWAILIVVWMFDVIPRVTVYILLKEQIESSCFILLTVTLRHHDGLNGPGL
jgi:hypothetical protein